MKKKILSDPLSILTIWLEFWESFEQDCLPICFHTRMIATHVLSCLMVI